MKCVAGSLAQRGRSEGGGSVQRPGVKCECVAQSVTLTLKCHGPLLDDGVTRWMLKRRSVVRRMQSVLEIGPATQGSNTPKRKISQDAERGREDVTPGSGLAMQMKRVGPPAVLPDPLPLSLAGNLAQGR